MMVKRLSRKWVAFLLSALCLSLPAADKLSPQPIVVDQLEWKNPPLVRGLFFTWVFGSEAGEGLYLLRVRLDPETKIPPHTHPDQRLSTVLSGTLYVGFGEKFDEASLVAIKQGDAYIAPAGTPHYIWAKDGEVVYQETGIGPTATAIIKSQ